MTASNFKVIVVGGGPVGLVAAHALAKAGIDFVVLERRPDVTIDEGASLALWPPTYRLLDQLDLLESMEPVGNPLRTKKVLTLDGSYYGGSDIFSLNQLNHGYAAAMYHRADIMKVLYNNMNDSVKSRVLLNKRVTAIQVIEDGVRVSCDDGSVTEGSMVMGVDGVNSSVRRMMHHLVAASPTPLEDLDDDKPYLHTYRLMFGNAPRLPEHQLEPGVAYESHGTGITTQYFVGRDRTWFFVYERLEEPKRDAVKYTRADEDAFAARLAHIHLTDTLTFGEVYKRRNGAGLSDLGEGVVKRWSWNRIVLAGDAAHKVTPNIGWGFNSGAHDVIVLTNLLRHALAAQPDATAADLDGIFASYQAERKAFADTIVSLSAGVTRMVAWSSGLTYFLDRYLWSTLNLDKLMSIIFFRNLVSAVPVLDFLEEKHFREGKVPWLHHGAAQAAPAA